MAYRQTPAVLAAKERRAAQILTAARTLVATGGFGVASARRIAEAAGISVGTIYTYFRTREELLAQVFRAQARTELDRVRRAVEDAGAAGGGRPAARQLTALIHTFAGRALRGRQLAWALLVEPVGPLIDSERLRFRRAYADTIEEILTAGISTGELPSLDPRIAGPGLVGMISEALTGPLAPADHHPISATELTDALTELCLAAIEGERP